MVEENKRPNISDKEVINTDDLEIAGVRALPSDLAGASYQDLIRSDGSGDEPGSGTSLDTPKNLVVKSQTIKFNPDGTQLVDVVIEFDVVEGAQNYEVRLSKQ